MRGWEGVFFRCPWIEWRKAHLTLAVTTRLLCRLTSWNIVLQRLVVAQLIQEIVLLLWDQNVQFSVYRNPSPVFILSHVNPIHTLIPTFLEILL